METDVKQFDNLPKQGSVRLHSLKNSSSETKMEDGTTAIKKMQSALAEANKNRIQLDIDRVIENQYITDMPIRKIIDKSLDMLKELSKNSKPDRGKAEENIKLVEKKIENCLELLVKLNKSSDEDEDVSKISYKQANIFIYFVETLSLEGDPETKSELKKYFSQYYTELDRRRFSTARHYLLKVPGKKLGCEDIKKFINGDVKSFFKHLERYLEYIKHVKELKVFLQNMAFQLRKPENKKADIQSFLKPKFEEKFNINGSKIRQDGVFDYTAKFYPAFQKTHDGIFKKFSHQDVEDFFIDLQKYARCVQHILRKENPNYKVVGNSSTDNFAKGKDINWEKLFDLILNFDDKTLAKDPFYKTVKNYAQYGQPEKRLELLLKSFEDSLSSTKTNKTDEKSILKSEIKQCIGKYGKADIVKQKFQKYLQNKQEGGFFLKTFTGDRNMIDDISKSYVKKEFGKLIASAYTEENITQEVLFNYVVNFHPACENLYSVKELRSIRNNLIHNFHKYGAQECRKEFYKMRHKLFNYFYAEEVIGVLSSIKVNERSKVIDKKFNEKLKSVQDKYINGLKEEYVISTDEAQDFAGYKLSQELYTERDDDPRSLVDQYLKFMIIFDHAEELITTGNGQDKNSESRKELNASGRREIFEKFDELIKIHSDGNSNRYKNVKTELEKNLSKKYGVPKLYFDNVCSSYVEDRSPLVDDTESEKITDIVISLKKIRFDYKLSNRFIVSLYGQHLKNEELFRSDESRDFVKDESARQSIIKKFKQLPPDENIDIEIGEEKLSISRGNVIINMLNTFYNAYHKYTIQFDIEKIFNDETFINYLVENETENTKVEDLVDPYLKLTFMIDGDRQETYKGSRCKEFKCETRKKIFEGFCNLKNLKEHVQNECDEKYYQKEVEKYKDLVCSYGINQQNFYHWFICCIENNYELIDEEDGSEKISSILHNLRENLKQRYRLTDEKIASLYKEVMKGSVSFLQVKSLIYDKNKDEIKNILKFLNNLRESAVNNEVNIQLGSKKRSINIGEVVDNMLEAFADKLNLKPNYYMIIQKLLRKTDYTAPYIARLISKVTGDVLIEKDDLVRLVEILLNKKEGLYIKYLNELLMNQSRRVNIYEEVCNIIAEQSFDIYSMEIIFEEFQHAKEILTVLIDRIKSKDNQSYFKMVELSRKVLELIINSIFEYKPQNNENGLEILNCGLKLIKNIKSTSKELGRGELIGSNKSKVSILASEYNIKLKMAKVMIHQGQALENDPALYVYKEALEILREIPDTVHLESLLAIGREASTRYLFNKYDVTYDKGNSLIKKIVKFVCGADKSNIEFNTKEIYTKIEGSKKYETLLTSFSEHRKCLNILHIGEGKYNEALEILRQIPDNVHPQSLLALSCEASTLYFLKRYEEAYEKGDILYKNIANLVCGPHKSDTDFYTKEMYTKIERSEKYKTLLALSSEYTKHLNILYIREEMARARQSDGFNKKSVKEYKEALEIYNEVCDYKKVSLGEEHTSTLKDIRYIAAAHMALSNLMFTQSKYQDALENATDSCIQNCTLFDIQQKMYGNYHPAVKQSIKFVVESLGWISSISDKIGDVKSLEDKEKPFYRISLKFYYQIIDFQKHSQ